ncbi:MAG: cation diffusion facilitator family transporter [Nitrospirota bacterium]
MITTQRGIWAIKWSFLGLGATALLQGVVVFLSGSAALLADTIHNIGDAATAIPLWVAFLLVRLKPTRRFTYGYGRIEDLAGVAIVLAIVCSGLAAGYVSIDRSFHPHTVEYLAAVIVASVVGFAGNEAVAVLRIRVGREIGSAALIADGRHAHVDALTSLSVLFGAVGVWLGYPLADPVVGLLIAGVIVHMAWDSGKTVLTRLLDGVDPEVVEEIRHAVQHTEGVQEVTDVRVRWLGHRLHAEVNLAVRPDLTVEQGHEIADDVRHALLHRLRYLSAVMIHIDPTNGSGEAHHRIASHQHDDSPPHAHSGC